MNLQQGTKLQGGKYCIERFISSGGFGCTYEAEHVMLRKRLAIKEFFVKDFCNRDEETGNISVGTQSKAPLVERLMRKFIDEAVALSQMHHPHIVQVSDVFMENGSAYYVMDYIDGCSLDEMVKQCDRLPEHDALTYIRQVAEALDYVHSQNRLHLDIKPGNIMVDASGQAILIDFGVSKQYDSVEGENTSTLLGKTPGYAPIEQMGNSVQQFTPATDIYALGATLYKLLSGNTPPESTVIINDGIPELDDTISRQTRDAVYKSMEFRRSDRPQTIKEFLALLSNEAVEEKENTRIDDCKNEQTRIFNKEEGPITETKEETVILDEVKKGICNVYEWIDLGLSVKWATCNVGAKSPEDSGALLNWNEKDMISDSWEKGWRIPTKEEQDELRLKCQFERMSINHRDGYRVTGPNGNSIFLPFTGFNTQNQVKMQSEQGYYWSSVIHKHYRDTAYYLFTTKEFVDWRNTRLYNGLAIRLVCD